MDLKVKFLNDNVRKLYLCGDKKFSWNYGDSGIDLRAIEKTIINKNEIKLIQSGICLELDCLGDDSFEVQVRPRSSLILKGLLGIFGTVDFSYRGDVSQVLLNITDSPVVIEEGERLMQIVISNIYKPNIIFSNSINKTKRNDKGFGSTGNF